MVLSCTEERCGKLDSTVGDTAWLGTFQVKQGDRTLDAHRPPAPGRGEGWPRPAAVVHRERLLRAAADARQRAVPRLTWAAAAATAAPWRGCATSRAPCCPAARPRKASATSSPARRAKIVLARFPGRTTVAAAPPPPPAAPAPPAPTTSRRRAQRPRRRHRSRHHAGDFATADRLLADATRRLPAPRHGRRCSRSSPRRAPIATRNCTRPRPAG